MILATLYIIQIVKAHQPDYILIGTTAALVVLGLIMLWSASMVKGQETFGQPNYFLKHQAILLFFVGLPVAYICSKIKYSFWKKLSFPFFIFSVFLLIIIFVPGLGFKSGGATRWIDLGPISIQPSEIAKLAIVIYLASLFGANEKNFSTPAFLTFSVIIGLVSFLICKQPNMGTAAIICLTAAIVYFSAGAPLKQISLLALIGAILFISYIFLFPHATSRFQTFLHPTSDPQGAGYQMKQATIAIGSGGFLGKGLGQSLQKFSYLPETIGDSIFAIIAEELGFIGAAILIALFLIFTFRGFKIAKNAPDNMGKLLAIGITSWLSIQAFVNIAAISGLIPLTGVPLPFISYGSSGLIVALVAVGILVNISKYTASH